MDEVAAGAALSVTGRVSSSIDWPDMTWALMIVPQVPGVLMRVTLTVVSAGECQQPAHLGHVTLASVELAAAAPVVEVQALRVTWKQATLGALSASAVGAAAASLGAPVAGMVGVATCGLWWYTRPRARSGTSMLINGWQTFSFSGALNGSEAQPRTPLPYFSAAFHTGATPPPPPPIQRVRRGADVDKPAPKAHSLSTDLYGVLLRRGEDEGDEAGALLGFVTARHGAGGVELIDASPPCARLFTEQSASLAAGATPFATDWGILLPIMREGSTPARVVALQRTAQYMDTLASFSCVLPARTISPEAAPSPVGWCSWYCHGPDVNEKVMMGTLEKLASAKESGVLPIGLVQLDDGWQSQWGDWTTPHPTRFPSGLKPIASAIRDAGMAPGLWLAPAALTADSQLMAEQPQWLLKRPDGKPLRCGYTAPGIWLYALDVSHPEALAYIRRVVRTATKKWGFTYLKLDFLHTAAMPGAARHDPTITRVGALQMMMAAIRDEVGPDTFLLGCGAPLGPCIGHVDGMRVSADAAPHWFPRVSDAPIVRSLFTSDRTNMPAARNMVRNVAVRLQMSRRLWRNDPDCLILRDAGADFSLEQAQALSTVAALSAGALIFSDRPADLSPPRLRLLQALLPPLPRPAVAADLLTSEVPAQLVLQLSSTDAPRSAVSPPPPGGATPPPWWLFALFNWSAEPAVPGNDAGTLGELLAAAATTAAPSIPPAAGTAAGIVAGTAAGSRVEGEAGQLRAASGRLVWHVFDFWSAQYARVECGLDEALEVGEVAARCGRLLALRRVPAHAEPQLVGSSIHISCGLEVRRWRARPIEGTDEASAATVPTTATVLEVALETGRAVETPQLWIYLPGTTMAFPPTALCSESSAHGAAPPAAAVPLSAEWVTECVWKLTLCPIGKDGSSPVHRVVYSPAQ